MILSANSDDRTPKGRSAVALLFFAVGYNIMHHNVFFGSMTLANGTRLADWIDLVTPFTVLGPLLWFLEISKPSRTTWFVAAIGSALYIQGHGMHLSSNSISNATTSHTAAVTLDVIYLWDEVVGHYIWFAGLAVVLACCAASTERIETPMLPMAIGSGLSGLTWATNGLEGGTAVFSSVCAVVAVVHGLRRPHTGIAAPLVVGGIISALVLAGYGLMHGGFPQPSAR